VDNHPVRSLLRASAVACGALLLALPACSGDSAAAPPGKTISIGVDLPLTGVEGRAGTATLNGVRFFVQRHPLLDGFAITVDARDDPAGASRATARGLTNLDALVAQPRVLAIIGPFDSSVARAQIPVANRAHLALVSPGTSSRCLTKEPFLPARLNPARTVITCHAAGLPSPSELRPTGVNNFFRLSATDELQGPAAADYATRQLHLQRVAVLTDGEAYGQGLADSFTARFIHLGGTVVAHMDLNPAKVIDAGAFLQVAKNDRAQGVYFGGTSRNHSCVLRSQMSSVFGTDTAAPLLGGDGIALDPTCVGDAGASAVDIYATVPAADAAHVDSASPVIAAFRSAYGRPEDFGPGTVAAYDATGVIYDALDRAIKASAGNLPARDSVVAELAATRAYSGTTGVFGFDPEGDSTLRLLSIFRPAAPDLDAGWTWVATIDYSAALPY
jgi:branched-chain amino acid transport system substrate-binding protein